MSEQNASFNETPSLLRRLRLPLMVGVPIVVFGVAGWMWLTGGRYVSTDDAFIQTGRVQITCNVSGKVAQVAVHDNERVKKGQLLFRLEGGTQIIGLEAAAAQMSGARSQVDAYRAVYRQRQDELAAAQLALSYRQRELTRNRDLAASGVVSKEEVESAAHELDVAALQVATARGQLSLAAVNLGPSPDRNPALDKARADFDKARVTHLETVVYAPQDGVVTKVSQLQVGAQIPAATPLFTLITDEMWVDANFKESDLAHMRPGQHAVVKVDAHPDLKLDAKVESISPGTGSSFSLLPAENATGNWVKVVQRVPVRLVFTRRPPIPLQAGLSASVKVDSEHRRFGGSAPKP